MSPCEMVKTLKQYYLHNMREREAMSICEMVKTLKLYYLHNMRKREREREGYVPM